MPQLKYVKEPGYIYDLMFVFVLYYNKDICMKKFINPDKGKEDIRFFEGVLSEFPKFPEELQPFFYMKDEKGCFMSTYYFQEYLEHFFNGYGTEYLYLEMSDTRKLKFALVKFYLNLDITFEEIDNIPLHELSINILNQNMPDKVKQWLMIILMEPELYCKKLMELMKSSEKVIDKYYEKNTSDIVKICNEFNTADFVDSFKKAFGSEYSFDEQKSELSICLIVRNLFRFSFIKEKNCIILGLHGYEFAEYLEHKSDGIDLSQFGRIMSDQSRIKIIQMLVENEELFTGEIAQELNSTLPSCYYHLEMMLSSKMLNSRSEGRTVFYSINQDYFKTVSVEIINLITKAGEKNENMEKTDCNYDI